MSARTIATAPSAKNIHGAPFGLIALYPKANIRPPDGTTEMFDTFEAEENLIVYRCRKCGVPMFFLDWEFMLGLGLQLMGSGFSRVRFLHLKGL
jgi:hypothetical protein